MPPDTPGTTSEAPMQKPFKPSIMYFRNVRKVEEIVRHQLESGEDSKGKVVVHQSPYLMEIEDKLRAVLGTQIHIQALARGGKIEIRYFSNEDLERIIELIQQIA